MGIRQSLFKKKPYRILENLFDENGKIQIEANKDDTRVLNIIKRHKKLSTLAEIRTGIMGLNIGKWSL